MSLQRELKMLEAGEYLETDKSTAAIYKAAKGIGYIVTTRSLEDGRTGVTVVSASPDSVDLLSQLRALPREERLELIRKFEPCCAARKGACICEVATNQKQIYFANVPDNVPLSKLCTLCCEEPCVCWEWTVPLKLMHNRETDEWLREQRKEVAPEEFVHRVVRVDSDDHDRVMEVK
jgi:hypothetical protein